MDINILLQKLDECGSQGLDLSLGDELSKSAAKTIRGLLKRIKTLEQEIYNLDFDRPIHRI